MKNCSGIVENWSAKREGEGILVSTPSFKQNCVREISVKDKCRRSLMSTFSQGTYRLTESIHTAVEVFRKLILDLALSLKTSASPNT